MTFRANVRSLGLGLMFFGLVGLLDDHLNADGPPSPTKANQSDDVSNDALHRAREGSKIVQQLGEFRETGGRIAFYPEGSTKSLVLLENLALERVSRDLEQGTRKWNVSGAITEYRGANYLLIERAVLKQRSAVDAAEPRS
ncbi:MAG: hypothetical protein CMJ64_04860 [Planctomycetaceae bacterium]|nr:hypothetical protein [Planctomycetaceae bacterium]